MTDPDGPKVCAAATAGNVSPDDPNHSVTGISYQIFSTYHPNDSLPATQLMALETMLGFIQEEETAIGTTNLTRAGESVNYISQDLIPVYNAIAQNFVVIDQWFADVPGPTNPNRWILRWRDIWFPCFDFLIK